jgi:hypothetical protein
MRFGSPLGFVLLAALAVGCPMAARAGCVTGAIVGGVAGHIAGGHAGVGAAAGCVIGHEHAEHEKAKTAQQSSDQPPPAGQSQP